MITQQIKRQIITALAAKRKLFTGSDSKFSVSLGINAGQYSRIKDGELDGVLSDANWIKLAGICGVKTDSSHEWVTVQTPYFQFVTAQLSFCQNNKTNRILCDIADIGKTHAAQHFAATHENVVYADCSQLKNKHRLIKYLAKAFGVSQTGTYYQVYDALIEHLPNVPNALVILDEAGDLDNSAFLEIKALVNGSRDVCAWYMMGADGLEKKIDSRITNRIVGYTETLSRFGNKYMKEAPADEKGIKAYKAKNAALIVKANFPAGVNIPQVIAAAEFTLRNLRDERKKLSA